MFLDARHESAPFSTPLPPAAAARAPPAGACAWPCCWRRAALSIDRGADAHARPRPCGSGGQTAGRSAAWAAREADALAAQERTAARRPAAAGVERQISIEQLKVERERVRRAAPAGCGRRPAAALALGRRHATTRYGSTARAALQNGQRRLLAPAAERRRPSGAGPRVSHRLDAQRDRSRARERVTTRRWMRWRASARRCRSAPPSSRRCRPRPHAPAPRPTRPSRRGRALVDAIDARRDLNAQLVRRAAGSPGEAAGVARSN